MQYRPRMQDIKVGTLVGYKKTHTIHKVTKIESSRQNDELMDVVTVQGVDGVWTKDRFWEFFKGSPRMDPSAANSCGETPLHFAARLGNTECARILLDAGANKWAVAKNEKTPAYEAWVMCNLELRTMIIEYGRWV